MFQVTRSSIDSLHQFPLVLHSRDRSLYGGGASQQHRHLRFDSGRTSCINFSSATLVLGSLLLPITSIFTRRPKHRTAQLWMQTANDGVEFVRTSSRGADRRRGRCGPSWDNSEEGKRARERWPSRRKRRSVSTTWSQHAVAEPSRGFFRTWLQLKYSRSRTRSCLDNKRRTHAH